MIEFELKRPEGLAEVGVNIVPNGAVSLSYPPETETRLATFMRQEKDFSCATWRLLPTIQKGFSWGAGICLGFNDGQLMTWGPCSIEDHPNHIAMIRWSSKTKINWVADAEIDYTKMPAPITHFRACIKNDELRFEYSADGFCWQLGYAQSTSLPNAPIEQGIAVFGTNNQPVHLYAYLKTID